MCRTIPADPLAFMRSLASVNERCHNCKCFIKQYDCLKPELTLTFSCLMG